MDPQPAPDSDNPAAPRQPPDDRLPLAVSVGFTGHRTIEDAGAAGQLIAQTFELIGRAFRQIAASEAAGAYDGEPILRLLVGGAPGADRLAQQAWRAAALGEVHTVYPFRDSASGEAFTDDPAKADPATRVGPPAELAAWTGFDAKGLGLAGDQAHAEVARWMVRHADLLVAWWNGKPGQGLGGAHDTLQRALERGLPVIWLEPGRAELQLIDPSRAHRHADAAEVIADLPSIAGPLTAEALAALLAPALAPPGDGGSGPHHAEHAARLDYARVDPLKTHGGPFGFPQRLADRTLWRAYKVFERAAGGAKPAATRSPPPAEAFAAQPGFQRLRRAASQAGGRADHLSSIHRSEQLLLTILAVLAVFFGALPALVTNELVPNFHLYAAAIEFVLGLIAFGIAAAARRAHRHRRWSDARRLTERLRGATSTWPLGFDIADVHAGPVSTWTEWRARAVLRAAGPRCGWITKPSFEESADWAVSQLIDSQIAYHGRARHVAHNIERTMRWIEGGAFAVLMGTLAAYLVVGAHGPHWFGGLVTLVSAVSPAVGAACLAMEATNGFGELAAHSAQLQGEFEQLKGQLTGPGATQYHHVLATVRRGVQLLVDDADAWRDRLQRRRLVRGG
jgi:hypothetical protein